MISDVVKTDNGFKVILQDGTSIIFSAHSSALEDCASLLATIIHTSGYVDLHKLKDVYIGYDDKEEKLSRDIFGGLTK